MNKKVLIFLVLVAMSVTYQDANAVDLSHRFGLSFGFPYLGVKYGNSQEITSEFRINFDGGVGIIGGREYYNFLNKEKYIIYSGLEAGYIFFYNVEDLKGNGFLGLLFVGGEYFLLKNISLGADFGPSYIYLSSKISSQRVTNSGLEWIINISVNYYFK